MQVLFTLASAAASSLRSSSMACRLHLRLPAQLCQGAVKSGSVQTAAMSSLTPNCIGSTSSGLVYQYSALKMPKSFLHNQSLAGKKGLHWTTKGVLLRVRGAMGKDTAGARLFMGGPKRRDASFRKRTGLIYVCAAGVFMLGMSYAGVPLYRMFCQATGLGGTVSRNHDTSKIETMQSVPDRVLKIRFNADVASSMRWNFKPQQSEVKVLAGETALAFYTAKNPTDKPIIGISTYNVVPFEAGLYFNKIQCFCFEEQRLNPHEQVDMPVFFYIDPEFTEDPKLQGVDTIMLSYTFFEAKEGFQVPLPGYMTQTQ